MRATHTFILRLLVNSAEPQALRGDLRPLPEGEPMPFADEEALLALLHRMLAPTEEPLSPEGAEALDEKPRRTRRTHKGHEECF